MDAIHKLTSVITKLEPNAAYAVRTEPNVVNEEVFNNIEWHTETALTWDIVKAKMDEVDAEYDSQEYARKREGEYPKIGDQLDKIYHEGIDAWKADMITPIKNKYPKE